MGAVVMLVLVVIGLVLVVMLAFHLEYRRQRRTGGGNRDYVARSAGRADPSAVSQWVAYSMLTDQGQPQHHHHHDPLGGSAGGGFGPGGGLLDGNNLFGDGRDSTGGSMWGDGNSSGGTGF
jgi:hypothetical protein